MKGKPQMSDETKILDTLTCEIKIFNSRKKLLKKKIIKMNVEVQLAKDNEGGDVIAINKFKDQQENIQ